MVLIFSYTERHSCEELSLNWVGSQPLRNLPWFLKTSCFGVLLVLCFGFFVCFCVGGDFLLVVVLFLVFVFFFFNWVLLPLRCHRWVCCACTWFWPQRKMLEIKNISGVDWVLWTSVHILCPRPNTGTKCLDLGYAFLEMKASLLEWGEEDAVWKNKLICDYKPAAATTHTHLCSEYFTARYFRGIISQKQKNVI